VCVFCCRRSLRGLTSSPSPLFALGSCRAPGEHAGEVDCECERAAFERPLRQACSFRMADDARGGIGRATEAVEDRQQVTKQI
jgi:hypothetical protein